MNDQRADHANAAAATALRLVPGRLAPPESVPRPPHRLVGRTHELERIRRALVHEGKRLVTLTGTGGVGKTRLAIEAAHELWPQLRGTVVYVAARAVTAADDVVPLIAAAAGWTVTDESNAIDVVEAGLAEQPTLLVLDNGEQIDGLSALLDRVLHTCPTTTVLLTSRRVLGLPAEHVIAVAPLPNEAAATLLTGAARRHNPSFEVSPRNVQAVAELCRRLDGLPLALELAAARLRLITPDEMVTLLDRRFDLLCARPGRPAEAAEPSGLWATIDWSYQMLDDDTRRHFRALAVFPDTFTLAGAAAVAGCDSVDMLDSLGTLVDHHLVETAGPSTGATRFTLLETLREFAAAELDAAGERERVADAHAEWCVATVRRWEPEWTTPREREAVAELDREHASVRAALAWCAAHGDAERTLRIMSGGWRHWRARGRSREAFAAIEAGVTLAERSGVAPSVVASALQAAGELADDSGELTRSVELFERAVAIHTELGNEAAVAEAQNGQAQVLRELGQLDRAAELHAAAGQVFRRLGMHRLQAASLNGLGGIASRRGDHAQAAAHFEHAYSIVERIGDRRAQGLVAGNVGIARFQAGDLVGAIEAHSRGLTVADELGDPLTATISLLNRAEVHIAAGQHDAAEADLARAEQLAGEIDFSYATVIVPHHRGLIAEAEGRLGVAARWHAESLERALAVNRALDAIECVERLAMLAAELGDTDLARRAIGITQVARAASGSAPTGNLDDLIASLGAEPLDVSTDDWPTAIADLAPALERFAVSNADAERATRPANTGSGASGIGVWLAGLSPREADVARLVVTGMTDRQIADELFIGVRTVATHVSSVLRKLGVRSRREVGPRLRELGADL